MEIIKVAEGALANLIAASILALVAWFFSLLRNSRLERKLEEGISPNGIGTGYDPISREGSFSLQIHNYSHVSVRVHQVILLAAEGQAHIQMEYDRERGVYQTPLLNEVLQPDFSKKHLAKGFSDNEYDGIYINMPPKTMGIWHVNPKRLGERKWFIREVFFVIEYPTIFGNSALVKLQANEDTLKSIRENFSRVCKCVRENIPLPLPPEIIKSLAEQRKNITNQSTSPAKNTGRAR